MDSISQNQDHFGILQKYFQFSEYRGPQRKVIERVLAGGHALVLMPTGSGKSLTYQVPALCLEDLTVVISPLIALMKDQVDVLRRRGIDAAYINSSLSRTERETRYEQVEGGKFKLLYVTPERFRKAEFRSVLKYRHISLLAVDEAHCISEWGHDFRPDYTRLKEFRSIMGDPVTLALTATATPDVRKDIIAQLGLSPDDVANFHEGIDRPNLFLGVQEVWGEDEKISAITDLIRNTERGSGIIYMVLIKDLYRLSDRLKKLEIRHLIYHGELNQTRRREIQERFMADPDSLVLATNAFGMGIDKPNIRFVIHAQVPGSLEAYYQEIGRSGRDGLPAECRLLYDEQDLNIQLQFIQWSNPQAGYYDRLYRLLKDDMMRVNSEGLDYLRENLSYKDRFDFRLETALGMLDRYGVTEGSLDESNLRLVGGLPEALQDEELLEDKRRREQEKLYQMVRYTKEQVCRKAFIHEYFGLDFEVPCGACDLEE